MDKPVCDICGINDSIVYIQRPEGTFCASCHEKREQLNDQVAQINASSLEPVMKKILIADLNRSGLESYAPGTLDAFARVML